jgi:DNA-binding HxlR family transcriptional regulator
MPLPSSYTAQACSLARTLEIVGERWTLLIVRDAFYGVRSFGDFAAHLSIPRAVLTDRLNTLVDAGVLERVPHGGRSVYALTAKGISLWPTVYALMEWGDDHYAEDAGPRRLFRHAADDGTLDRDRACAVCGRVIAPAEIVVAPGPGLKPEADDDDPVTQALRTPHRLLVPLR